jgi:hypothetical protein
MKKRLMVLGIGLVVFAMAAALPAARSDDYKVIKNAVKSQDASVPGQKDALWFRIVVTDKAAGKEEVKISLPVSLVEMMINACPDEELQVDRDCRIDIRKIWSELKKAGPLALVEIDDHEEKVKIWME